MVDAEDLKSFGHCDRVGSSPTNPTTLCQGFVWQATKRKIIGCVAQLVRALRSHRGGRRFESAHIHHPLPMLRVASHKNQIGILPILFLSGGIGREPRGSEQACFACAVTGARYDTSWHNGNYNPPTSTKIKRRPRGRFYFVFVDFFVQW